MKRICWRFILAGWIGAGVQAQVTERSVATARRPLTAITHRPAGVWQTNPDGTMIYIFGNTVRLGGPVMDLGHGKRPLQSLNPLAPVRERRYWSDLAEDPHTGRHKGLVLFYLGF